MNRSLTIRSVMVAIMLQAAASAQTRPEPLVANLCDVFASPAMYSHRVLSVRGVLFPSIHSVFLLEPSCKPKEDIDSTTEVILPSSWVSLPKGKELRKFLHRGKSASVKLVGTFEGDANRYGPDGARFRFSISEISSVDKAPGIHP